ncbi:hybrid sensor histidine kinase/response regulator [Caballeronia arationis]|jgi:signal transduction histidine kinase|uniref:hybrid sensor histidine kinase/response regulator n=1 Tax=Caballeronia arationis TaxID=1777142 RepID=UPI001ABE4DA4|nr:PAS domain-containing hybrid sensor histidine kinase/response regulator [Caballeronia arationis]
MPRRDWLDLHYSPVDLHDGQHAGALAIVIDTTDRIVSERKRATAEAAYRATNERMQLALNSGAVLGSFVWEIPENRVKGDERFARTFSYPVDQAEEGLPIEVATEVIHPSDLDRVYELIKRTVEKGAPFRAEYRIRRPGGSYTWIMASGRCDYLADGKPLRFPGVIVDIHDRKVAEEELLDLTRDLERKVDQAVAARLSAEEQLRQSQKMEALGSMTGGVAHDFNNVLQIIAANVQLLTLLPPADSRLHQRIGAILAGVERGAKLTSQLLSFARRQPLLPMIIGPRRLFGEIEEMLRQATGDGVAMELRLPERQWNVRVDRNQLENALLNLAINARDAVRGHGRVAVSCSNEVLDAPFCEGKDVVPGEYVRFAVSDDGCGMTPEVLGHAIEPFFTTKPDGHGTGLGLSMVFGFVNQSGGHLGLSSSVGVGTTVEIFFPRCFEEELLQPEPTAAPTSGGGETILAVEDDPALLAATAAMLEAMNYSVLKAASGDAALSILDGGVHVDLILTDVVMPGAVKSSDLAEWAFAQRRYVPVVYVSGYTRDMIAQKGVIRPNVRLLNKPYTSDALGKAIRSALESR